MRPFLLLVLTALAMAVSAPLGAQQGRDLLAWEEPLRALSEQVFLKEAVGDVVVHEAGDISGTLLGLDRDGPGGGRPRVRARATSGSQWISWQAHPTSGAAVKTFGIRLGVGHGGSTPDPDPDPPPTTGCVPTTTALQFDGGYKVSMCYRTPAGEEGQAKSGVWASGQSGILWFFDRGNAEVLVKVLDGCANNGHRWVFVAPVTTLEFNLWVTGPNGDRWPLSNQQGVTAATKSDTSAFKCADENGGEGDGDGDDDDGDAAAPDLVVSTPSVNNSSPRVGGSFTLRATVRNQGDARSAATTLRYYRSSNSSITSSDTRVGTDAVGALAASGTSAESISLTAPSSAGTYYYGACVGSVSGESDTTNNCSTGVRVVVGGGGSDAGNSVRLMYVSPANREFRADYSASMASAIVDAQDWYRGQMDGLTFSIDSLVPEWCRLPRNDDYYARGTPGRKSWKTCNPVRRWATTRGSHGCCTSTWRSAATSSRNSAPAARA